MIFFGGGGEAEPDVKEGNSRLFPEKTAETDKISEYWLTGAEERFCVCAEGGAEWCGDFLCAMI